MAYEAKTYKPLDNSIARLHTELTGIWGKLSRDGSSEADQLKEWLDELREHPEEKDKICRKLMQRQNLGGFDVTDIVRVHALPMYLESFAKSESRQKTPSPEIQKPVEQKTSVPETPPPNKPPKSGFVLELDSTPNIAVKTAVPMGSEKPDRDEDKHKQEREELNRLNLNIRDVEFEVEEYREQGVAAETAIARFKNEIEKKIDAQRDAKLPWFKATYPKHLSGLSAVTSNYVNASGDQAAQENILRKATTSWRDNFFIRLVTTKNFQQQNQTRKAFIEEYLKFAVDKKDVMDKLDALPNKQAGEDNKAVFEKFQNVLGLSRSLFEKKEERELAHEKCLKAQQKLNSLKEERVQFKGDKKELRKKMSHEELCNDLLSSSEEYDREEQEKSKPAPAGWISTPGSN